MNLLEARPELCKQWHPTKNGDLNPEKFSVGSGVKVWWKCPISDNHEWMAVINNRANKGRGCPYCANQKTIISNSIVTTHPEVAKQWHPTKNSDFKPENFTAGSHKKVWWKCPVVEDHEWLAAINARTSGRGCHCCSGRMAVKSNCIETTHPEIANQWHPTKNGDLKPKQFTTGSHKKVWWKCAKEHVWQSMIKHRICGCGCPKCNESRGEKAISVFFKKHNIPYKPQHKFKGCVNKMPLKFDFFVMDKFLIEYQGKQHYEPFNFGSRATTPHKCLIDIQKRDQIKRDWCKSNNIPLLEIPYWEFDKIEEHITQMIKGQNYVCA